MKYSKWSFQELNQTILDECKKRGFSELSAVTVAAGGFSSVDEACAFLAGEDTELHDPFLLKDMDKAAARIRRAIDNKEKIAISGDYDVDGITSVCLMLRYFERNEVPCCWHIPNRLNEGYGLNEMALRRFKAEGASLVITVDSGITAIAEAEYAKELGLDLIITDHHTCREALPEAAAVINPCRNDDIYPFKELAGVGVAFKLIQAVEDGSNKLLDLYSDLVALGTIADVMKMTGENRTLVRAGLKSIREARNTGIKALLKEAGTQVRLVNSQTVGFVLAPRMNAAGRLGQAEYALELLMADDDIKAGDLARTLCEMNTIRQQKENIIFDEVVAQIENETGMPFGQADVKVAAVAGTNWHTGVIGIVASRVSEKLGCPVFLACTEGDICKGSARGVKGVNLTDILQNNSGLLLNYGGHALAAGFTIETEKFNEFKSCVVEYCGKNGVQAERSLQITGRIEPEDIEMDDIRALSAFEPFGAGNPQPVFSLENVLLLSSAPIGGGRHSKLRMETNGRTFECVWFGMRAQQLEPLCGGYIDAAFRLEINRFRDLESVQLQIVDIRLTAVEREKGEREMGLYRRFGNEEELTQGEWEYLHPVREDMAAVWRYLSRYKEGVLHRPMYLFAREIIKENKKIEAPVKVWIIMDIFHEFGLISLTKRQDEYSVAVHSVEGKADLSSSKILHRFREHVEAGQTGAR